MFARGRVFGKLRAETIERATLMPMLEPLEPPPPFEITGPLSEVTCPAAKAVLECLIANLVDTGRAVDATT